jgi:hypothetical protein
MLAILPKGLWLNEVSLNSQDICLDITTRWQIGGAHMLDAFGAYTCTIASCGYIFVLRSVHERLGGFSKDRVSFKRIHSVPGIITTRDVLPVPWSQPAYDSLPGRPCLDYGTRIWNQH